MTEEPLAGGYVNPSVVRIGDTVRRQAGSWTPTIHRLMGHVRARGVAWVPEPHGLDERGREVLAFIPGEVPHAMSPWAWSPAVLHDVAIALRQWHDATVDFPRGEAEWNFASHEPAEVICHNDFAPYNCVFREGRFVGAIDYDLSSPGPRLWDLAYTAYRFVPLLPAPDEELPGFTGGERSPFPEAERRARLEEFLDSYAGAGVARLRFGCVEVLEWVVRRLQAIAEWNEAHYAGRDEHPLAANARMYRAHAAWLAKSGPGDPA